MVDKTQVNLHVVTHFHPHFSIPLVRAAAMNLLSNCGVVYHLSLCLLGGIESCLLAFLGSGGPRSTQTSFTEIYKINMRRARVC
jgi:hypothetical protein